MAGKQRRAKGEGGIYKRQDGRYEGRYTVQTATGIKRKAVYGKTRADVATKLAKALAERENGLTFDAGKLTVGDYLTRWMTDSVQNSVRHQTFESYERLVRLHMKPALGHVKLKRLTPAHVQGLYREKLNSGLSSRTVQYVHAVLHRALKQAVKWGLVPRNVCEAVVAPRPAIRPLSPEQARTLLSEAAGDHLEALYVLALTTGLRQGELLELSWSDVDLEAGQVRVRRTLVVRNGKPTFGQPKTAHSRRTVALTPKAVAVLKRHRGRQRDAHLYDATDLVFCTSRGTPIAPTNLIRQSFKPLLKRSGLPNIRFHDLRHTCATLLLGRGIHPKVVQDLLGHAQITLTLDTYSHVLPDMQAGAVDAMRDVLEDDT